MMCLTRLKIKKGVLVIQMNISRQISEEAGISGHAFAIGRIEGPDPYTVWQDKLDNGFVLFGKVWDNRSDRGEIRETWDAVCESGMLMTGFGRIRIEENSVTWLKERKRRRVNCKNAIRAMVNGEIPLPYVLTVAEKFRPQLI